MTEVDISAQLLDELCDAIDACNSPRADTYPLQVMRLLKKCRDVRNAWRSPAAESARRARKQLET
jgi:hypothetical protein